MRRACLILILVMLVMAYIAGSKAHAMPPHPEKLQELEAMAAFGGEVPNFNAMFKAWEKRGINTASNLNLSATLAASDTFKVLALIIQNPDKSAQTSAEFFDTLIFADQQGTVRHYYLENSYGTLEMTAVVLPSDIGWLTSDSSTSYYTSGGDYGLGSYPGNAQKLVEEAIDKADAFIDYSDYDNDSNGWLDALMVVHSGRGAEYTMNTSDIWSHKWGISPRSRDGVYISNYSMMPEYWSTPGDMTCGVYVHELGHVLGLPDLYDTDYTSRGIGKWSVMASGSWNGVNGNSPAHFDAWSKIQLGFATATNVTTTMMNVDIPNVENNPVIYRLWTNGVAGDEYFLVENKSQTGYDAALPGEGLLIWHIDDNVATDNDNEWYPPSHTGSGHYQVALEQADGLWQLEQKLTSGDAGDPYPGSTDNRAFSPLTTPGTDDYAGSNTLVAITNISDPGDTVTADFTVSFASAAGDEEEEILPQAFALGQNYPNPFNAETVISFSLTEASHVELTVYNILGQEINTLVDDNLDAGTHAINWDSRDTAGEEVATGIYFYKMIAGSEIQCRKMLLLK